MKTENRELNHVFTRNGWILVNADPVEGSNSYTFHSEDLEKRGTSLNAIVNYKRDLLEIYFEYEDGYTSDYFNDVIPEDLNVLKEILKGATVE